MVDSYTMDSSVIIVTGGNNDEIIDLTDSFSLIDHYNLGDVLIEVDSDSSHSTGVTTSNSTIEKRSKKLINRKKVSPRTKSHSSHCKLEEQEKSNKSSKWGECPICWDELGKNRLASTKCGHVFCLNCLKTSLKAQKTCPTCRSPLTGSSSYHPLYLN